MTISSVLVVDNDPGVCTFMQMLLEKEGMEVRTAEDGLHALEVLTDFSPDVMFIDLVMPNISGDKLGQVLRSQDRFADTYLIILSAISSEETIDYVAWGFDACVAKGPFKSQGEVVLSVLAKLGSEITRTRPGGVYGVENLYKREITRELLSTKRHFELTLKNMTESIIETTAEGRIVFVNPAATKLLDTPEEELLSTDLFSLFRETPGEPVFATVTRAREGQPTAPFLIEHRGKTVRLQILTVNDEGVLSIVIIGTDVTEKRRAEEALQRAHDELEERVRERTAELASVNESLKTEIEQRTRLERQLRDSLREKEVMLDEIHHRVKNNMQVISSLMGLNANRLEDPESREIITDMKRRVQSLSLVHDRLYQSGNLSAVEAQDYFRRLADGLIGSLKRDDQDIHVTIDAQGVSLPIQVAVPCALITNEAITNSLKHAFPEKTTGTVYLSLKRNADMSLTLVVEDDGVGIPDSVEISAPATLGLRIIKVLAKQLGASIKLRRTGGTRLQFDIPPERHGGEN
jgi:PAS domain S-box-containing protein